MDIAELGLSISSSGVVVATDRLDKFERQATRTDKTSKMLVGALSRLATVAGGALAAAFSVRAIFAYQDALAEVSTLVDTTTFNMGALSAAALDQGRAFGDVQGQVQAYYQIISAGASTVEQATATLEAANKLAVGGVTTTAIAADGLTSVLNAYGDKVKDATAVSDALFIGMRAGKTTIEQLSSGLGKVAPLAAQTGVSFDELVGSVSALTKGGIATQEAITGVRAILAAVAKPTSEAVKLSKALGIEFNSAGLEAKGFEGFLADLVSKTGGNTDALAQLFGGVEALVPIMALSGQAGKDFTTIMEQMADKAGATEEAFNKMAASPGFQAKRLFGAVTAEAIEMSSVVATLLVPALTVLADNATHLSTIIPSLAAAVATLLLPQLIAMTPAILAAAAAFGRLTLSMLTNPFTLAAVAIGLLTAKLIETNSTQALAAQAAQTHAEALTTNANAIETAKTASQGFRDGLRSQIELQVAAARAALDEAGAQYKAAKIKAATADAFGTTMRNLSEALFGEGRDPRYGEGIMKDALDGVDTAYTRLQELETQLGALGEVETNYPATVHTLGQVSSGLVDIGGSAKAANDNVKLLDQGLGELTHWTESFGKAAQSAFSNLGTGIVEAFRKGGDVASNVLNMLMDKVGKLGETLLNNGLNGLLNMGLNALGGMFGGGTWGVAGGFSGFSGIFGIPGMATGGTVGREGLSWVGEKGPELLRLPQGAQVIPNGPSMAMAANQNGGDIYITNQINVPAGTSADVAPAIAREVTKELRRQLPDAIERHNRNPLRRAG